MTSMIAVFIVAVSFSYIATVIIKPQKITTSPPEEEDEIIYIGINKLEYNPRDRKRIRKVCQQKLSIVRNYEYN